MSTNLIDKIAFRKDGTTETYIISNSVPGYLNSINGKFYKESTYTTEITGIETLVYVDLATNYLYRYDETNLEYVQIGGGGSGNAIEYVNSLPSSNIEDIIYGIVSRTSYTAIVGTNFLDSDNSFEKTEGTGGAYIYTPANGTEIEASTDGTTYKGFISLEYDGTDWTLSFSDSTSTTIAAAATFYYKIVSRNYYAGNKTEQSITPFASSGGGGGTTYVAGHGIRISGNVISDKTFIGTQAEWDALTPAEQAEYDMISITDDGTPVDLIPGHIVLDGEGTAYTQRTNLQFDGATVTDDSVNDITIVTSAPYTAGDKIEIIDNEISCDETVKGTFIGTTSEWENLSTAEKARYDIVNLTNDIVTPSAVVNTVENGNMNAVTSNAVYDELSAKQDKTDNNLTTTAKTIVGSINEINNDLNNLNNLFVLVNITMPSMSIPANSYAGVHKSIAKSGYTPIAVAGVYSGSGYATLVQADFYENEGSITLKNTSTAALSVTGATLRILYIKN